MLPGCAARPPANPPSMKPSADMPGYLQSEVPEGVPVGDGESIVHVCIDAAGNLTEAPSIAVSSGQPRLDEGALQLAQSASRRYKPTVKDGKPVGSCFEYRIRFQMRD